MIHDPISKLNPEMLYRQLQFLVDESNWQRYEIEAGNGKEHS
ncbi:hypothetical protein [Candidatus Methylomirabilis sp.]|nr:hypothetical protein [Candidatus Methylomirabilis sp.]